MNPMIIVYLMDLILPNSKTYVIFKCIVTQANNVISWVSCIFHCFNSYYV